MSNPNTSASKLLRAIVLHGPITGADLAIKTGIAAKSIDSLLESATTRDAVTSRRGFCAEKGRELKHYMTTTQAGDWDGSLTAAEKELIDAVKGEPDQDAAAHVMSAPASTKQSEGEIPVNETATENAELAEARRTIQSLHDSIDGMLSDWTDIRQALDVRTHEEALQAIQLAETQLAQRNQEIHTLKNDVAGAHLVLQELAKKLSVEKFEDIPGAFDELTQALAARAMHPEPVSGRLALITYSDNDADLQYLEPYVSEADASRVALNQVNTGTNERCTLIRVLGEAQRPRATWQQLGATGITTLRGERQEAA